MPVRLLREARGLLAGQYPLDPHRAGLLPGEDGGTDGTQSGRGSPQLALQGNRHVSRAGGSDRRRATLYLELVGGPDAARRLQEPLSGDRWLGRVRKKRILCRLADHKFYLRPGEHDVSGHFDHRERVEEEALGKGSLLLDATGETRVSGQAR